MQKIKTYLQSDKGKALLIDCVAFPVAIGIIVIVGLVAGWLGFKFIQLVQEYWFW